MWIIVTVLLPVAGTGEISNFDLLKDVTEIVDFLRDLDKNKTRWGNNIWTNMHSDRLFVQ